MKNGTAKKNETKTPQIAPVAIVSVVYEPQTQRVLAIQPQFPLRMSAQEVLMILRAAQEQLIAELAISQAQSQKHDQAQQES